MATQEPCCQKHAEDEPVLTTAEDTARVSNAVDLLMDLCAERTNNHDETALDVVAHVGAEVRAMAAKVAATIKSKAHASVAVEDLQALHARAMSALETAGIPSSMEKVVAKLQAAQEEEPAVSVVQEEAPEPAGVGELLRPIYGLSTSAAENHVARDDALPRAVKLATDACVRLRCSKLNEMTARVETSWSRAALCQNQQKPINQ